MTLLVLVIALLSITVINSTGQSFKSGPQGNLNRPAGVKVPKNLNWDVWLGPAPEKLYHPDVCNFYWRGSWDYGTGTLGDSASHIIDAVLWSLNLKLPNKIQATTVPLSER